MVNKKSKALKDIGYEEVKKPTKENAIKTKISRDNPSVNKNSQFGGEF